MHTNKQQWRQQIFNMEASSKDKTKKTLFEPDTQKKTIQ